MSHLMISLGLLFCLDIYLIGKTMDQIGILITLLLLILMAWVGSRMVKLEGMRTLEKIMRKMQQQEAIGSEMLEGSVLLLAGLLYLLPGFLSDLCATLLLLPPIRRFVAILLSRHAHTFAARNRPTRDPHSVVIDGETIHKSNHPDSHHLN
ncbi:FxsA family protein [Candidatus Magnetaquicoccus inordinatus]|uniref:FxsA family protein n=1 Tax=Candidatus Magnetaquicoccus inordinatus TaxID=2496818 RepID=UPI00102B529F|nr:FxsA family protein [Candidatus Magnetaquicoccus inordinatus]